MPPIAGRVALFAREHMYIRTMPIVMVVELAKLLSERTARAKKLIADLDAAILKDVPALVNIGELAMLYDGTLHAGPTMKSLSPDELREVRQSLNFNPPVYNLRGLVSGVISRADELTDLYAYALTVFSAAATDARLDGIDLAD